MTTAPVSPAEALIPQLLPPTLAGGVERDNSDLTRAVHHETRKTRPDNTSIAYDPKVEEFRGYCDSLYNHLGAEVRYQVTPDKVYNFIFYQSHREKKKPGKGKRGERRRPVSFRLVTTLA
jgi:hypothetical protein